MIKMRMPYLIEDVDRHGNVRTYFRKTQPGPKIRIRHPHGSPEFIIHYRCLLDGQPLPANIEAPVRLTPPGAGTFGWLIKRYTTSSAFTTELHATTQRARYLVLESCAQELVNPKRLRNTVIADSEYD